MVTGAGRGIGRAYARLLAERGARVVVNDLGGSMHGSGSDPGPAAATVAEIVAAGGEAVADQHDVATVSGADALIAAAIGCYGRVDVIVNNAGIMRWAVMPEVDAEALAAHLAVHVAGSFHTVHAAWPTMVDQGYGRIVMTTSTGMLGLPGNLAYATAKGGVFGMMRSLATAGADHDIRVNCIAPAAYTRMADPSGAEPNPEVALASGLAPALVAPMVAFLAHEDCPVSGEIYTAGAGRFARLFLASTEGVVVEGTPTVEDVADHWAAINDEVGYFVPADLPHWSARFTGHHR